jgi:hypothetical protein
MNPKEFGERQILKIPGLTDFIPQLCQIGEYGLSELLFRIVLSKVPENEKDIFGGLLLEYFEVDFHDRLDDAVLGGLISAYFIGPDVDEQHVGDGQAEECH